VEMDMITPKNYWEENVILPKAKKFACGHNPPTCYYCWIGW
ncbi:3880_t:CDS:1, partial [Diversispora eburnea]